MTFKVRANKRLEGDAWKATRASAAALALLMHTHSFADEDWPFHCAVDTGCVTTRQVYEQGYPILGIVHDEDGTWMVLCKTTFDPNDGMLLCLGCMFEKFPFIGQFASIPPGYEAVRTSDGAAWKIVRSD